MQALPLLQDPVAAHGVWAAEAAAAAEATQAARLVLTLPLLALTPPLPRLQLPPVWGMPELPNEFLLVCFGWGPLIVPARTAFRTLLLRGWGTDTAPAEKGLVADASREEVAAGAVRTCCCAAPCAYGACA